MLSIFGEIEGRIIVIGEAWLPLLRSCTYVTSDYDLAVTKYVTELEGVGSDLVIAVHNMLPFRDHAFDELVAHAAFNDIDNLAAEVKEALRVSRELFIVGIQGDRGWVSTPLFNSSLVAIKNKLMAIANEYGSDVVNTPEYFLIKLKSK